MATTCGAPTQDGGRCNRRLAGGRCPHHGVASSDPVRGGATADAAAVADPFADAEPAQEPSDPEHQARCERLLARFDNGPQKVKIPYQDNWFEPCSKCGGTGIYQSVRGGGGSCSACQGTSRTFTKDGRHVRDFVRAAESSRVRDKIIRDLADNPDLAEALDSILERQEFGGDDDRLALSGFAIDVATKWVASGALTDR